MTSNTEVAPAGEPGATIPIKPPPSCQIDTSVARGADILDAERALIGCLLHLAAAHARPIVAQVGLDDLADPALGEILAAIAALVTVGVNPEPTAVLSLLRHDGRANGQRYVAVATLLADLYTCTAVPASAGWYAARVLEEATRRRAREAGERVAQAAELVPIADLPELVTRELTAVITLAERAAEVTT
jgi:replicative DNA helicase